MTKIHKPVWLFMLGLCAGVAGSKCTAALVAQSVNTTYYVSQFSGSDIGAQINAADTAAGSAVADIVVNSPGRVTTIPSISTGHRLILAAPVTWSVSPVLHNNTAIIGKGQTAVQTISTNAPWITSVGLSGVEISGVWFSNSFVATDLTTAILRCRACYGVTMRNNHALGVGLLYSDSTSNRGWAGVNSGNLTKNVIISDNFVDGLGAPVILADLQYTSGVTASNNTVQNALYNVEWWGGNAATDGIVLTNNRWASNINITGGSATNVRAGFWGDMGENVTVTGVTVDNCSDVCLDAESSTNVVFSGFTVHNSINGGLAVFFSSQHVAFGPGAVTSDTAVYTLIGMKNLSANPTQETDVKVQNVKFVCLDHAVLCPLVVDPIGAFQFNNNEATNSKMIFTGTNTSGIEVSHNTFSFTYVPAAAFSAILIPGHVHDYKPTSVISDNTFQSSVKQAAGTFAINATITDYNFSDVIYVRDNNTKGFTNDARFVANSTNRGITPTFIFSGNKWGANSVTHTTLGALGSFKSER